MEEKEILELILENTQEVKQVVVKEKKEKTAKQKAEAKFKLVGTKLNPLEQERFKKILEVKNTNANAYIKSLIFSGNELVLEEALQGENENLKSQLVQVQKENTSLKEENENIQKQLSQYQEDFEEFREAGFFTILKEWLKAKRD